MHNKTKREKVSPLNMLNVVIRELRRCYTGRGGVKSEKETEKWKAVKRFRFGDVVNSDKNRTRQRRSRKLLPEVSGF